MFSKKILITMFLLFALSCEVYAATYVRGYTRRDGTYVSGHYRSTPNYTRLDNYSTKGNYNPYTGKAGTINPYNKYGSSYNNNYQKNLYSNKYYNYRY